MFLWSLQTLGTIFMDLSKAFDTLNDNFLFAKLNSDGSSFNAIKLAQSYLSERFRRVNSNNTYSEWRKILLGVPQGSVLGEPFIKYFHKQYFLF